MEDVKKSIGAISIMRTILATIEIMIGVGFVLVGLFFLIFMFPVFIKPTIISLSGTKPVNRAYLLGVVKGYIQYEDKAVSMQSGKVRVIFLENSGLAGVVPMDFVKEIVSIFPLKTKEEEITERKSLK